MPSSDEDLTWTSPLEAISIRIGTLTCVESTQQTLTTTPGRREDGDREFASWKPYRFLARSARSSSMTSSSPRRTAPPLSLSRIVKETSNTVDLPNKIIVLIGMITDDICLTEAPNLTIAALCFTRAAKERILNAGGDTHRR
ncbi:hypothetical protein B0H14DRAFT_3473848 [Mycena olivaceomarginata]|nr:hypothetical protein B0H14DRAFT_3473848 [Mycena olivaceomarginata]